MKPDQKALSRPCPARIGISDGTSVIHCGCEGKNPSHRAAAEKLKREGVIPWGWADVREAARKHGWTRRTEPAGWRPVETDVWGHYPPGEKFIDGEQGWVRVGLRDYALVIELTGPPIRITELGGEVRRDVKLVDPTPAEVLTAARLVGLDGARS